MAKAHYIGVDGVARKVKKQYVGVDGVARNVTKGYVGVNGVARQYFFSGLKWKKYNCKRTDIYEEDPDYQFLGEIREEESESQWLSYSSSQRATMTQNDPDTWIANDYSPNYEFHPTHRYMFSGKSVAWKDSIGYYYNKWQGYGTQVEKLTDYTYEVTERYTGGEISKVKYKYTWELVAICHLKETRYTKGSTLYGEVTAPEEEYPEDLTYVKGSLEDGYYVLRSGGTYYYYTLVEE